MKDIRFINMPNNRDPILDSTSNSFLIIFDYE